jgi:mRNA interferase RelE/StbE
MSRKRNGREPGPAPSRYEIQFTRAAERGLASLPKADRRHVDEAILGLADDRHPPGSKKLQGEDDLYRIRVGDYRVIYKNEKRSIECVMPNVLGWSVGKRHDVALERESGRVRPESARAPASFRGLTVADSAQGVEGAPCAGHFHSARTQNGEHTQEG